MKVKDTPLSRLTGGRERELVASPLFLALYLDLSRQSLIEHPFSPTRDTHCRYTFSFFMDCHLESPHYTASIPMALSTTSHSKLTLAHDLRRSQSSSDSNSWFTSFLELSQVLVTCGLPSAKKCTHPTREQSTEPHHRPQDTNGDHKTASPRQNSGRRVQGNWAI